MIFDVFMFLIIADVGGFFGNPDSEIVRSWGSSFLFSEPMRTLILNDESLSYLTNRARELSGTSFVFVIPLWYTVFRETPVSGIPILKYGPTVLLSDVS